MDFTLKKYRELLVALEGYGDVILRHDVDLKPQNSLATAKIENELGWMSEYYFRAGPDVGVEFEPCVDTDFSRFFYLTDTRRR